MKMVPPFSVKSLPTHNTHNTYAIRIFKHKSQVKDYDIYTLFIILTRIMIPCIYLYYTAKSVHICNKAYIHLQNKANKADSANDKVHLKQIHKLFT